MVWCAVGVVVVAEGAWKLGVGGDGEESVGVGGGGVYEGTGTRFRALSVRAQCLRGGAGQEMRAQGEGE